MDIVSVPFVRESENYTMQHEPIASINLMERAGTRFAEKLITDFQLDKSSNVIIFCGQGNNGGDGLVVARVLAEINIPVLVVIVAENDKKTADFASNFALFCKKNQAKIANFEEFSANFEEKEHTLVVDALFGIGLSRPLTGYYAEVVNFINAMHQTVVALDAPSGLFLDVPTPPTAAVVHANFTYTFQWQKWAYLLPENAERVGEVSTIDIGLMTPPDAQTSAHIIDKELIRTLYIAPKKYANKGTNGHGVLFAGCASMPGAAVLAATAALRAGIGKVTVHTTQNVGQILPSILPEAILDIDPNEKSISVCKWDKIATPQAIAIGPGIGRSPQTTSLLKDLLSEVQSPMIFDADALNILAENKTLLAYLPKNSILTPHFKEFERLTGSVNNDFERIEKLQAFAQKYSVIVVLKGQHSVVAMPDGKLFVNTTGNAGMATAGSGDVLTGVLLACMAKEYPAAVAALLAVYLHGAAGDCALTYQSMESLIASDICLSLGDAFRSITE